MTKKVGKLVTNVLTNAERVSDYSRHAYYKNHSYTAFVLRDLCYRAGQKCPYANDVRLIDISAAEIVPKYRSDGVRIKGNNNQGFHKRLLAVRIN